MPKPIASPKKDPTAEFIIKWMEFINSKWKQIALVFLAVIVVVAVIMLTLKHKESSRLKAELEYFEIMKLEDLTARALKLEEFADKNKGEDLALVSYMWLGNYYVTAGNKEKAIAFYEQADKNAGGRAIKLIAIDALAPIYEDAGNSQKSAELYLKEAVMPNNANPLLSKLNAARVFALSGEVQKAEEIYNNIIKDEDSPTETKLKAEEDLLWLKVSKR